MTSDRACEMSEARKWLRRAEDDLGRCNAALLPVALLRLSGDGAERVRYANPRAEHLLMRSDASLRGRTLAEALRPSAVAGAPRNIKVMRGPRRRLPARVSAFARATGDVWACIVAREPHDDYSECALAGSSESTSCR